MFKVTWNKYWGTRFQDTFITLYYTREPSKEEILRTFKVKGHDVPEQFTNRECSGMITVSQIEVEF